MTPLVGFVTRNDEAPLVSRTGLVSPTPRATPRITAVARPGLAVGRITWRTTRHRLDPRASPASRRPPGTTRSTTSAARAMIGSIITPIAIDAASPEGGRLKVTMKTV